MAHDQRAEHIGTAGDLVVHDALVDVQLVIVAAHLVERGNGLVARAVGVMHRRAVHGLAVLPDGELVGDGERLAVADDHALDVPVRHPGADPGVDAHARDADLVLRAVLVLEGVLRELLFMRAPAELGGRGAFLAEALDAPGVHKLVHLLRQVCDLRVALGAVDDLDAQGAGQVIELTGAAELGDVFRGATLGFLVGNQLPADVDQALLDEMRDEPGIRTVLDDGRRALGLPLRRHPAKVHVAPVERLFRRMGSTLVRVPQLSRGVDIHHAVVAAPLQDLEGVDVPGQVDQKVAGPDVLREQLAHVLLGHAVAHETDPLGGPWLQLGRAVFKIHHRDIFRRHLDVLEEDRQRALGNRAVTDEEDFIFEFDHDGGTWASSGADGATAPGIITALDDTGAQTLRDARAQ